MALKKRRGFRVFEHGFLSDIIFGLERRISDMGKPLKINYPKTSRCRKKYYKLCDALSEFKSAMDDVLYEENKENVASGKYTHEFLNRIYYHGHSVEGNNGCRTSF